jgi:hypothetical protein
VGSSSCIIGRPSLIRVCWVLFGAWLLCRSNYDCIWHAKYPPLLCIEIGRCYLSTTLVRGRLESFLFVSLLPDVMGIWCLFVPFVHGCLRLPVLAGMHPVNLVGSLLESFVQQRCAN